MKRWLRDAVPATRRLVACPQAPRRVFGDAPNLVTRRYVDLLLVNSCLCRR
ncbi:hypothetical protein [Mycolicibacterium vaccae]|uniref:hypothetical protein n=1 Tax=Mycolicibacterium vaccae TaxID=1810 RepID=UPI003D0923C0